RLCLPGPADGKPRAAVEVQRLDELGQRRSGKRVEVRKYLRTVPASNPNPSGIQVVDEPNEIGVRRRRTRVAGDEAVPVERETPERRVDKVRNHVADAPCTRDCRPQPVVRRQGAKKRDEIAAQRAKEETRN